MVPASRVFSLSSHNAVQHTSHRAQVFQTGYIPCRRWETFPGDTPAGKADLYISTAVFL